jgi:hypothetical protein
MPGNETPQQVYFAILGLRDGMPLQILGLFDGNASQMIVRTLPISMQVRFQVHTSTAEAKPSKILL